MNAIQTTSNALPIAGYSPLLEAVRNGQCDGLFVPRENLSHLPVSVSLDRLTRFLSPQGELLLRERSFRKYGYDSAADFAYDSKRGLLQCRSVAGALTLGAARFLREPCSYVMVSGTGLPCAPVFLADSPEQEAGLMHQLQKLYPAGTVFSQPSLRTGNFGRFFRQAQTRRIRYLLWQAPPPIRRGFRVLLSSALLAFWCLALDLGNRTGAWMDCLGLALAFLGFVNFARAIRRNGPLRPPP